MFRTIRFGHIISSKNAKRFSRCLCATIVFIATAALLITPAAQSQHSELRNGQVILSHDRFETLLSEAVRISANELIDIYNANKIRYEKQIGGKIFIVTGKISEIRPAYFGKESIVSLHVQTLFGAINVVYPANISDIELEYLGDLQQGYNFEAFVRGRENQPGYLDVVCKKVGGRVRTFTFHSTKPPTLKDVGKTYLGIIKNNIEKVNASSATQSQPPEPEQITVSSNPSDAVVEIEKVNASSATPPPPPKPPKVEQITVSSNPSGAVVEVDGRRRGNTPLTFKPDSWGEVTIRVSMSGYEPSERTVEFEGESLPVSFTLSKAAPPPPTQSSYQPSPPPPSGGGASIFIATLPPKAEIYIGGRLIGMGNEGELQVPVGKHQVRFVKDGIEKTETMTFDPGKNQTKFVNLR